VLLVGLTGGIASGKTLVSDEFVRLGAALVDADILAREVVTANSDGVSNGLAQLVEHFGTGILTNNELNRSALRELIFSNPDHRKTVDGILHPLIHQLADSQLAEAAQSQAPYAIYAIPLLVETDQQERFDRIVVVDVPTTLQISRLVERDGGTVEKAIAILESQASREARLAIADDVIDNSGSIDATLEQVARLHNKFLGL